MSKVRSRSSNQGNRSRLGAVVTEGERPSELLAHLQKQTTKQRQQVFEQITNPTKLLPNNYIINKDKTRAMIPTYEKKKVSLAKVREGDVDVCAASYANLERAYYSIWQAPKKENLLQMWRFIWQEGVKLVVCLSDQFSETDDAKCYPYWAMKEGESVNIQAGRFVVKTVKKTENKGFSIYDLVVTSSDADLPTANVREKKEKSTDDDEKKTDDGDEKKPFKVTLLHLDSWAAETWPDLDVVANFVQTLTKREIQIVRKQMDQFVPPVVIQSHDGIGRGLQVTGKSSPLTEQAFLWKVPGTPVKVILAASCNPKVLLRAAAVWVTTSLNRDIEARAGFDVDDLVRKIAKLRPGALTSRLLYSVTYALAYRSASLYGWIPPDAARDRIKEIKLSLKITK